MSYKQYDLSVQPFKLQQLMYMLLSLQPGYAVMQVVALSSRPEGRGFDYQWGLWDFSLTQSFLSHYGPGIDSAFNPLAPEFSLKIQHTLYLKCEYYRNRKRQRYEINGILKRKKKRRMWSLFNLLKPTGHVMHQQFNIQQLYVLPTLCLCVLYLSENKQRLVPLTA